MENQEQEVVQNWEVTPLATEEKEKTVQVGKRYTTFEHYSGIRNFNIVLFDGFAEENKQYVGCCVEDGSTVYFNSKGLDEYKETGGCHNALDLTTERDIDAT
jgi:outer membrane receptor for Fe3+-dicitrate